MSGSNQDTLTKVMIFPTNVPSGRVKQGLFGLVPPSAGQVMSAIELTFGQLALFQFSVDSKALPTMVPALTDFIPVP